MPKIAPEILNDFGRAVKRARTLKGWDQKTPGGKIDPPVGASFISKVEKGRKEALDARTVGRFRLALDLDETWIDKFLDAEEAAESLETKSEQEADRVIDRLRREGKADGTSDDLLIQLANNFTEGDHKDLETAYRSVEAALQKLKESEQIALLAGNADAQFAALIKEVDALNNAGEFDQAHDMLAQNSNWLREEKERLIRLSELQLDKELSQDRLRNRPDLAAKRIVRHLREFPQGKLFWAVDKAAREWRDEGDKAGDIFALKVALALASGNYERAKNKKPLTTPALYELGWCHMLLAERLIGDTLLKAAQRAFHTALIKTSKAKQPENWAAAQGGLGIVLLLMGEREKDTSMMEQAVKAQRAALKVSQQINSISLQTRLDSFGSSLRALGELTRNVETLQQAETALINAVALENQDHDPLDWQTSQNNLALAQRWLGAITGDGEKLQEARDTYAACELLDYEKDAPFEWAKLQWNIADLAVARHQLDPDPALLANARERVRRARAFFVDGSEYQTKRCDELLSQIDAVEAGL